MYRGMSKIFGKYWCAYGGFNALIKSPYLHLAILLLALTFKIWTNANWWDISISVLPNLLGFTLGGFAVFLAFGDDNFREMLIDNSDDDDDDEDSSNSGSSLYVELCSTFVHFIVVQILAFFLALISKSLNFQFPWNSSIRPYVDHMTLFFWGLGFLVFLYSMTSILAATMHLFRTATWYEMHQRSSK